MGKLSYDGQDVTTPIISFASPQVVVGRLGSTLLVYWNTRPTAPLLAVVESNIDALMATSPAQKWALAVDIDRMSGMPDQAAQQKNQDLLKKYVDQMVGGVVLLPASNRLTGLLKSAWGFFVARLGEGPPLEITTDRTHALAWLQERMPSANPVAVEAALDKLRNCATKS